MGLARFLFLFLLKAVIHPWEMCTLKSEAHLRFFLMEKVSRVTRTPLRNILGQIFMQEGFYSFKSTLLTSSSLKIKALKSYPKAWLTNPFIFIFFFNVRPQQERAELQISAKYTKLLLKQQKTTILKTEIIKQHIQYS